MHPSFGPMPPLPYSMPAPPQVLQGVKKALQLPNMKERSLAMVPQLAGLAVPQPMKARLTSLLRAVGPQALVAHGAAAGVAQPLVGAATTYIGCAAGAGISPVYGLANAAGAGGTAGIGA